MNATYDGRFFVCPDAPTWADPEDWRDGYRNAMLHNAHGRGELLDGSESHSYSDGYGLALDDVATYLTAQS